MKKNLLLILLSMIFTFFSFASNSEPRIEKPEYLKLIYKKYYKDNTDFKKMTKVEALLILEYAESVDDSVTGASGSISLQRHAYNLLMGYSSNLSQNIITIIPNNFLASKNSGKIDLNKKSEKSMITLFLNAKTNEGKVYALMGLSSINFELYKKYYEQMDLEDTISTLSGCFRNSKKIGDFLKKPEKRDNVNGISGFSWF
jgi:hypothetical protein